MSIRLTILALLSAGLAAGQAPESLAAWRYYQEIATVPAQPLVPLELTVEALDAARQDHADLRLYDAAGGEVPYALRIRREIHESEAFEAQEINRGELGAAAEVTLDLGPSPAPHNELEIDTAGDGFRRRVTVEGSEDGERWLRLAGDAILFRFASQGRGVDQRRVEYPQSDYRYLRVRVEADRQIESQAPEIRAVTVRRLTRAAGVDVRFPAGYPVREAGRDQGRPASIYRFELGGRVPLHGLDLPVAQTPFSRPYRLEAEAGAGRRPLLASGTLRSEAEEGPAEIELRFEEQFAARLVLTVVDDRNPPLEIFGGSAVSAARQILFDGEGLALPLRLYYGNPDASPPHYDFDATVSLAPPEGLFYVVLTLASLAILGLLRKVLKSCYCRPAGDEPGLPSARGAVDRARAVGDLRGVDAGVTGDLGVAAEGSRERGRGGLSSSPPIFVP